MSRRSVPPGYEIDQSWPFPAETSAALISRIEDECAGVGKPRELSLELEPAVR